MVEAIAEEAAGAVAAVEIHEVEAQEVEVEASVDLHREKTLRLVVILGEVVEVVEAEAGAPDRVDHGFTGIVVSVPSLPHLV